MAGWLARSSFMDGAAAGGGHGSSSEMMMVLDEIHNIFTDILVLSSGEDGMSGCGELMMVQWQ